MIDIPYGWGCVFSKSRANRHCINHSEKSWEACKICSRLRNHPEHDKIMFDLNNMELLTCNMFFRLSEGKLIGD